MVTIMTVLLVKCNGEECTVQGDPKYFHDEMNGEHLCKKCMILSELSDLKENVVGMIREGRNDPAYFRGALEGLHQSVEALIQKACKLTNELPQSPKQAQG